MVPIEDSKFMVKPKELQNKWKPLPQQKQNRDKSNTGINGDHTVTKSYHLRIYEQKSLQIL